MRFSGYVKLAKLARWARANGVHSQTAYRWFREDRMPVPARRLESGTSGVDAPAGGEDGERKSGAQQAVEHGSGPPEVNAYERTRMRLSRRPALISGRPFGSG